MLASTSKAPSLGVCVLLACVGACGSHDTSRPLAQAGAAGSNAMPSASTATTLPGEPPDPATGGTSNAAGDAGTPQGGQAGSPAERDAGTEGGSAKAGAGATARETCADDECGVHGACDTGGEAKCTCDDGYTGRTCRDCGSGYHAVEGGKCALDETCRPNTCSGHGDCTATDGQVQCGCAVAYGGNFCDQCASGYHAVALAECAANEACAEDSCSGHGACDDTTGVPVCECDSGYAAPACADCAAGHHQAGSAGCVPDQQCLPSTCSYHGACSEAGGNVLCDCADRYAGAFCESCESGQHRADDGACVANEVCGSDSCGPYGSCDDAAGVIVCECDPGWTGSVCDTCAAGYHAEGEDCVLDQKCLGSTCAGRGTCTILGGQTLCACYTGYAGDRCDRCYPGYALNPITQSCELPCGESEAIRCDGQCVSGASPEHCGSCSRGCAGGICERSHGGYACRCPYDECNEECTNTQSDEANCGQCGKACAPGAKCYLGQCRSPAPTPPGDGSCTDEEDLWCGEGLCLRAPEAGQDEDQANCGGCDIVCDSDEVCLAGACQPRLESCWWSCDAQGGELCCGSGACRNALSDSQNCGRCGHACAADELCRDGLCMCATPASRCGEECRDLRFDNANCGTCGRTCDVRLGERCVYGECVVGDAGCGQSCLSTELCCPRSDAPASGAECIATASMASSPLYCGGCAACPSGEPCSDGICGCSWPNGTCTTDSEATATQCVSLVTAEHCGECDVACTGGRICDRPTASDPGARCRCPDRWTWCMDSQTCVDLETDADHCGSCGHACGAGAKCVGRLCVEETGNCAESCSNAQACCAGSEGEADACTDVLSDMSHCGSCDTVCDVGFNCYHGTCRPSGDLCSAPALLPADLVEITDGNLASFRDDGDFATACGHEEPQDVEVFYVLEAPAEGAKYNISSLTDSDVGITIGTAESLGDVCTATQNECLLNGNPAVLWLYGPTVFMVYGPVDELYELYIYRYPD